MSDKTAQPSEKRGLDLYSTHPREAAALSVRAIEVFGSRDKAMRWLESPVPSLGYRTPVSLLSTPQRVADVENTLGAIEQGIW